MDNEILPLRTAFFRIFIYSLVLSGSTAAALWGYKWYQKSVAIDEKYKIVAIVHHKADLQGDILAELLDLSVDRPTYLTFYNVNQAVQKLLACPFIESAIVKKCPPNALSVNYSMRRPIVFLAEYRNAAMDESGVVVPYAPFYSQKDLPELVLGDVSEGVFWGQVLTGEGCQCAMAVLKVARSVCAQAMSTLKKIDVSRIKASSAGQREIVAVFQDNAVISKPKVFYLRLAVDCYEKNLENFLVLRQHICRNEEQFPSSEMIVDLRVPQLAFLSAVY